VTVQRGDKRAVRKKERPAAMKDQADRQPLKRSKIRIDWMVYLDSKQPQLVLSIFADKGFRVLAWISGRLIGAEDSNHDLECDREIRKALDGERTPPF
jgi:hypothetical protein